MCHNDVTAVSTVGASRVVPAASTRSCSWPVREGRRADTSCAPSTAPVIVKVNVTTMSCLSIIVIVL